MLVPHIGQQGVWLDDLFRPDVVKNERASYTYSLVKIYEWLFCSWLVSKEIVVLCQPGGVKRKKIGFNNNELIKYILLFI